MSDLVPLVATSHILLEPEINNLSWEPATCISKTVLNWVEVEENMNQTLIEYELGNVIVGIVK